VATVDFAPPLVTKVAGPLVGMAVGDLNGDGRPDAVTLSQSGMLGVLLVS
jgi:hypothetical protein